MLRGGQKSAADLARMVANTPSRTPQSPGHGLVPTVLRSPMHHSGGGGMGDMMAGSSGAGGGLGSMRPAPPRMGGGGQQQQPPGGSFSGRQGAGGMANTLVGKTVRDVLQT